MEEKQLYELKISPRFENALPPLQEAELSQLREKLLTEGCRDALVVFHGTLIDGHSRYRICHECGIPFAITELKREDEEAAYLWVVENQLSRRNVSDFAKCELVVRLAPKLKEEAQKRMLRGKKAEDPGPNLGQGKGRTSRQLAKIAGISHGSFEKAQKILEHADAETIAKLRSGDLSIHSAYTTLFKPEEQRKHEEAVRRSKEMDKEIASVMPGYGLAVPLPPREEGISFRPPDSVLEIPPIAVFGNMPADDPKYRGRAEMAYAKGEFQKNTDYYTDRAAEILQWMSSASINPENLEILREIVKNGYEKIMKLIGGYENEDQ